MEGRPEDLTTRPVLALVTPQDAPVAEPPAEDQVAEAVKQSLLNPTIRLMGRIDDAAASFFADQAAAQAGGSGPITIEIWTHGGDADAGRRIAEDIRLLRVAQGREVYVLARTLVASAGIAVLAATPSANRFMTSTATLFVHRRRILQTVELNTCLEAAAQSLRQVLADINYGLLAEDEGFREFTVDSRIDAAEAKRLADTGWYISAIEARRLGLIGGVIAER